MFDTPITVPDKISTLELSKIWLYKAFQNLEQELQADEQPEIQTEETEEDSSF